MTGERIGLLGGTFNPVHRGHLRVAEEVLEKAGLNRVLLIPSHIPPHKTLTDVASPEDRLAMIRLALAGKRHFEASSIEIDGKGKSYSIVTVKKIGSAYPGARVFFIVGVDAFLEIETWRSYSRLLEQCHFIVVSRPRYRLADAASVLGDWFSPWIHRLRGKGPIPDDVLRRYRIFLLSIRALAISATDIRGRVRSGRSIRRLVPPAVEAYIKKHRLYQE